MNRVFLGLGIDFLLGRRKHDVAGARGKQLAIALQRARILGEILMRRELQRIDENARDHDAIAFAGDPHEREMALMQVSHRRDERDVRRAAECAA